ncbi:MAG: TauD/TfdA dioxygenase family protein [Casimicrobiaceae bacterium]
MGLWFGGSAGRDEEGSDEMKDGTLSHGPTISKAEQAGHGSDGRFPLRFNPLAKALGIELAGVDCSQPLSGDSRRAIAEALERHHVLVVRAQQLDDAGLIAFAESFGEVERNYVRNADGSEMSAVHEVSNLDELGKPNPKPFQNSNFFWHSDKSYRAVPTFVTILLPMELPPDGGETQFANLLAAYAALPADVKRELESLKVVHSLEHMRTTLDERPLTEEEKRASPPVEHPLVRTHPATGARSLYLGIYCERIVGMSAESSRALLDRLLDHATQPAFVLTHRWRAGDVVAWDNRWLVHRALPNFDMQKHRRVMRRVVVKGSVPGRAAEPGGLGSKRAGSSRPGPG